MKEGCNSGKCINPEFLVSCCIDLLLKKVIFKKIIPTDIIKFISGGFLIKLEKEIEMLKKKIEKKFKKYEIKEKVKTYIPGFDELILGDGIPGGTSLLIEGGPGSGKTIFALQVAANACKRGKKVLYMSFEEPERKLMEHMEQFGWNPQEYVDKGLLYIKRFSALDVARNVEALLSEAKRELLVEIQPILFPENFKPDILCIDSLTSIASAFSGEESRFRIYMEQLFFYLEKMNINSFLIREVSNPTHTGQVYVEAHEAISFLSDGIVVIYNVVYSSAKRGFALEILKLRGEKIKRAIVKMEITSKGIVVYPNQELGQKERYTLT